MLHCVFNREQDMNIWPVILPLFSADFRGVQEKKLCDIWNNWQNLSFFFFFKQKGASNITGHLPVTSRGCTAYTWSSERSRRNTWVRALEIPRAKPATVPHKPEGELLVWLSCALGETPIKRLQFAAGREKNGNEREETESWIMFI